MRRKFFNFLSFTLVFTLVSVSCNKPKKMKSDVHPPSGGDVTSKDCTDTRGGKHAIGQSWTENRYVKGQSCAQGPTTCTCEASGEQGLGYARCPDSFPSQNECTAANGGGNNGQTAGGGGNQQSGGGGEKGDGYPIYGIFDRGAEHLMPNGGYVMDLIFYHQAGNINQVPTDHGVVPLYSHPSFSNKRVIVRLDYSTPRLRDETGDTAPYLSNPPDYDAIKSQFVAKIQGTSNVWGFVVGNEPNIDNLTSQQYAEFFKKAATDLKANTTNAKVIMAPIAPLAGNSIPYQNAILDEAGSYADAFCVQGKTRSASFPDEKSSDDLWAAFLSHIDLISKKFPGKPIIICELGPHSDTGSMWGQDPEYLKKAYAEIVRLNSLGTYNPIYTGITFRYDADMTPGCQNTQWSFCAHEDVFSNAYSLGLKGP